MQHSKVGDRRVPADHHQLPLHVVQETPSKSSEDERWVARTPQGGCIVISEPDPPPGALLGHMTFGGFNPALEQLQVCCSSCLKHQNIMLL